jgi:hypothetical protein
MKKILALLIAALILVMMVCVPAFAADTTTMDATAPGVVNTVLPYLFEIAASFLIAMIGVLAAWLSAKIAKQTHLSNIGTAVEQVMLAAQITVGELQQTTVNSLKAAQGGKLTDAQIADLKRQLLQKTSEKLSAPVVQLLEAAKTDVNAIIAGAAEDLIGRMKSET